MSLASVHLPPLLPFLSPKKPSPPAAASDGGCDPFDEVLTTRLRSLLPAAGFPPYITLTWLTRVAGFASLTLSDADSIISGTNEDPAIGSHLEASVALLDVSNAITAEIDRHHRRRLLLRLAINLLSSGSISKARSYITEWQESDPATDPSLASRRPVSDMIRSLKPVDTPSGKASAVRRAIYAVEAVSYLAAGAILAAISREPIDFPCFRVPKEFQWSDAYNDVFSAASSMISTLRVDEFVAVETETLELTHTLDQEEMVLDKCITAGEAVDRAVAAMSRGLSQLASAVDGLFDVALEVRSSVLQSFKMKLQNCK